MLKIGNEVKFENEVGDIFWRAHRSAFRLI